MEKFKIYGLWVVIGLLALAFIAAGTAKVLGVEMMHQSFAAMGLPSWVGYFIGTAEIAGGIGLFIRKLATWAAVGLTIIMLGASYFHIAYNVPSAIPAVILGLLSILVLIARRDSALLIAAKQ